MKVATFLMMYFFKGNRSDREYIEALIGQAKEQTLKSRASGIAFFNQILDNLSWFDLQTRNLVKKAKKEVLQNT